MKQIEAVAVNKIYHATDTALVPALEALDLDIGKQEFVCIVGPSGCGKSTLLTLLAGLEVPTSGELRIDGQPVRGLRPDVAMVFQDHSLLPWKTVLENVAIGLKARGVAKTLPSSLSRWWGCRGSSTSIHTALGRHEAACRYSSSASRRARSSAHGRAIRGSRCANAHPVSGKETKSSSECSLSPFLGNH